MNCLNLDNEDVQQWIAQESLEKAYQVYVDNNYILPDYSVWKQYNTNTTMSEIVKRFDAILPLSKFSIDKLSKLMNSVPISTQAAYLQQVIYLSENPKLVDVYEEGFHAIFDSLISDEEKKQLLSASQSILAKKLKAEGKTINQYVKEIAEKYPETYKSMTQKQKLERVFEEELAKMYVDSLQYKNPYGAEKQLELKLISVLGATLAKTIAKILTKAFDVLKSIYNMFTGNRDTISLFFKQINDGKYKNSVVSINENNTIPSTRLLELDKSYFDEDTEELVVEKKVFSSEETQRVIRNTGSIFFQLQHEEIKNSFEDRLNEYLFLYFKYGDIDDIYNKDRTLINEKNQIAIDVLKSDVASYVRDFNALIDFDTDTVESEQGTTNHFANYDKSADENNPYETSYAKQLKLRIGKAGRIKTDSTKAFQIVPIDGVDTRIAFTEAVDVYKTYSAITRALSNIPTSQERWTKLLAFAKLKETSDTKAFVEQLLYDMFKNEEEFKNMTNVSVIAAQSLENIENRKSGFIIFPNQDDIDNLNIPKKRDVDGNIIDNPKYKKIIGTNNSVIVNSIVKGFDLYKRTNNILTVDVKLDGSVSTRLFDTNTNNVRDIQYNTWINSITEIIDQANKEEPASDPNEPTTKKLLQAPISEFNSIVNAEEFAKGIQESFKNKGILLSIDYIDYSIAKFQITQKGYAGLTTHQQFLIKSFTIDEDLLLDFGTTKNIAEINKAFSNITSLTNIEGKADEEGVIKGGIEGRLKNIAEGNSYFSESIPDTTYKTPDGKKRYSYQYKTFHLQRINQILKSKGILPNTIPNQDYINPEFINENYILKKLKSKIENGEEIESEWQKLINQGTISIFSAAGLRQQDSLANGQKDESDGLTAGDMSNRDFMLYLLNSVVSLPSKVNQTRVTPIYFGNYEASTTYEFINLPFMKDLIDNDGKLTTEGAKLIEAEIKKEFNRIKRESNQEYTDTTDKYTKYNTGKYVSINGKKIPFKINKNGAKEIDFSNFRALAFSDYVLGLIGEDQINFSKDFEKELTDKIQSIEEGVNQQDVVFEKTDNGLLYKAIFGEEYKSELVIESIKKSVDSLNDITVDNIKKSGAIELLDTRYNLKDEGLGFIVDNVDVNIKKAATNNLLNTMFVNQLMQGDQALLYKNDGVDMFKRFKIRNAAIISYETDTIAPELGIDEVWKEMPFLVHDEIKANSGIDQKSIDQADAQNYGTLKYFRYAQYAMGRLNKDLANLYDMIDQGEDTTSVENKVFDMELYTPILKTVGFDSSDALKKSDVLLSKRLTSDFIPYKGSLKKYITINGRFKALPGATTEVVKWSDGNYYEVVPRPEKQLLHDRRKVMEGWKLDEKGKWIYTGKEIMLSMPISASKLLNKNTLKGHDLKNATAKNINFIDLRYYGLQVETAHPHDKIPDPTQYLEIALNELKQELGTSYTVDGIEFDTDKLINMYQEGLFQRDDIRFNELFNEIFTTDEDGKITFNKEEFKEIFVRSLEASGNEKQVIELAQEGQFNNPLIRDKYISQIFSYFTKDGLSQKRKGDAAPHFSSYGMKLIKKSVKHIIDGKEHWSWQTIATDSDEYKLAIDSHKIEAMQDLSKYDFYPDVDNKPHTRYTENRLQDAIKSLGEGKYFIDELRHLKPRVEDGKITGYFTEAILSKYEREQARIYDGQRYMFGVRIPSQDKHSGVNLEWVDMLPAHYGSAIAVAKEIVQLSGSDFDIDKLYISKPDGYYTKDGFKQFDNSFEDYKKYQLENNRALKLSIKKLKYDNEEYQNLKLEIDTIRRRKNELYNSFKQKEKALNLNRKELKSLKKLYEIKKQLETLDDLIEHELATEYDLADREDYAVKLQNYRKNNKFKLKDLSVDVEDYIQTLEQFYELNTDVSKSFLGVKLKKLKNKIKEIEAEALRQLKLPSDKLKYDKEFNSGSSQTINSKDRVVFGHPTIGKSYLKEQGDSRFISLDDDYGKEINDEVEKIANKYEVTKYQVKDGENNFWNQEYNKMMQSFFDKAKKLAIKENKTLFTSNTRLLQNNIKDFDKVIDIPADTFKERIRTTRPNSKYDLDEWKSQIDAIIAQVPKEKVIKTDSYLSDLISTKTNNKYSNRGYINNLLLQANQQGLANNQTLDGKIADDSASLTYMSEGVLKEFPLGVSNTENKIKDISEITNHSGGAALSDTEWDQIGREFGVTKHKHYREPLDYIDTKGQPAKGNKTLDSKKLQNAGIEPTYIEQSDYNEGAKKATQAFRMMFTDSENKLVRSAYIIRNWLQVKNADAIYALGTIKQPGENTSDKADETRIAAIPIVKGGTGYAVQMAINEGKPVYVFDGTKEGWYIYDYDVKNFVPTKTPTLTKNFAGIGSRTLSTQKVIDKSLQAIRDVYQVTKDSIQNQSANNNDSVKPQVIKNEDGLIIIENSLSDQQTVSIVENNKDLIEKTSFKQTAGSVSWGWGLQWMRLNAMTTEQKKGLVIGKQLNGIEITQEIKDDFISNKTSKKLPLYGYTNIDKNGNKLPNIPTEIINLLAERGIDISEYDASYNSVYDKSDNGSLIIHQDNTETNESPIITISMGRPMKFITYELKDSKDFNISDTSNTSYRIATKAVEGEALKLNLIPQKYLKDGKIIYGHLTPNNLISYAEQIDKKNNTKLKDYVLEKLKDQFKDSIKTEYLLKNGSVLVFSNNNRNVLHEIVFDEKTEELEMPVNFPELKINKAYKGLGQNDKIVKTKDYRVVLTLRKVEGKTVNNIDNTKLLTKSKEEKKEIKSTPKNQTLLSDDGGKTFVGSSKTKYNVHSFMGHVTMHNNITTGKKNIGIDVNWNLLSAVMQRIGAEINPNFAITIGGVTYDSLQFKIRNNKELRVFDVNSTLTSSATDEVKEQLNARYGLNIDALNAILPLINMGGNMSIGIALVNQQIIKDFLALKSEKNQGILTKQEKENKSKNQETFIKQLTGLDYVELMTLEGTYSIEDLAKGVRGKRINEAYMLRDFIKLSEITEYGANLIEAIKLKKGLPTDIYSFESLMESLDELDVFKDDKNSPERPIRLKEALNNNKNTRAKEIFGKLSIVNKINEALPELINLKKKAFTDIKNKLKLETVYLNRDAKQELDNELESFIYSQLLIKELKAIEGNTNDSDILKYLNRELIENGTDINNIELQFIKFKAASSKFSKLAENVLLKKLQISKKKDIVSLTLNQLVKLNDTEMSELQDSFTYLTNFTNPLKDSISPLEFTKLLQALFIVKDGMQFKYDGISKIFPTATFNRFGKVLELDPNFTLSDAEQKEFIKRYMESVKHKSSVKSVFISVDKTEGSVINGNQVTIIRSEEKVNSKVLNDKGQHYNYVYFRNENFDALYYKTNENANSVVYTRIDNTGATNISTMGIPMGQLVTGQKQLSIPQQVVQQPTNTVNQNLIINDINNSPSNRIKFGINTTGFDSYSLLKDFYNQPQDIFTEKNLKSFELGIYLNSGISFDVLKQIPGKYIQNAFNYPLSGGIGQVTTGSYIKDNLQKIEDEIEIYVKSLGKKVTLKEFLLNGNFYFNTEDNTPNIVNDASIDYVVKNINSILEKGELYNEELLDITLSSIDDSDYNNYINKRLKEFNTVDSLLAYYNSLNENMQNLFVKLFTNRKNELTQQSGQSTNINRQTLVESVGNKINTYQYYGALYEIQLNELNQAVDVVGYQGKNINKQKILDNYNQNPNIDPQNGKPFRDNISANISQALNFGKKSKNKVIPEGASDTNDIIFEDKENVYLMNNQQQEAFNKIKKVIDNFYSTTYSNTATLFENDYLKSLYNGKVSESLFNNMYGIQGSGGVGKTTLAKAISEYFMNKYSDKNLVFSSPTHKAATVLQESLGKDGEKVDEGDVFTNASLVGSLKEDGTEFTLSDNDKYIMRRKPKVGTDVDFIIFDEASMIDINYIQALQSRIINSKNKKVPLMLFLGDMKQLPPISKDSKEFNRGFISMALLANPDKSTKLTQIMRSSDEFFVRIFNSIGNQIERNIYNKLEGKPAVPYNYSELMQLLNTSKENLTVYNNENSIVQEYAKNLFENLNPKAAYYSHYNRIDNTVTIDLQNKIRNSYMEKIYGTTSHLKTKIAFPLVDEMLNKFGAKTLLNDEGISKIEDLSKVLQFIEIENVRSFIFGDYVQAPSSFSIESSYFVVDKNKLNSFAQKVIDDLSENVNSGFSETVNGQIIFDNKGSFKPSSRYRVLDIIQEKSNTLNIVEDAKELLKYTKMESVLKKEIAFKNIDDNNVGIYIKNKDLTLENVLLYTRQNRIRANSYIMNTYSNYQYIHDGRDSNYKPINPRQIYTLREGGTTNKGNDTIILKLVVPWHYTKDEDYKRTLHLLGKNVSNFEAEGDVYSQNHFTKSYLGSSHTTQGDAFTKIFAGVSNVLGQTMAGKDDIASSLYTILTRSMKQMAVLNKAATYTDSPQSDTTFEEINENC